MAAERQKKVERFTSVLEGDWLLSMVDKYDDDVDRMAKDRKINPWQKTAGEIKRACVSFPSHIVFLGMGKLMSRCVRDRMTKAGGHSKLKAKLVRMAAELEA